MSNYLKDKVAVVTGAGGTLCSEIARELAKEGVKVFLVGRTEDKLVKVAEEIIANGGWAKTYAADVTDKVAIAELAKFVEEIPFANALFVLNNLRFSVSESALDKPFAD